MSYVPLALSIFSLALSLFALICAHRAMPPGERLPLGWIIQRMWQDRPFRRRQKINYGEISERTARFAAMEMLRHAEPMNVLRQHGMTKDSEG